MTASPSAGSANGALPPAPFRLGVFSRLVDDVAPAEIYARALTFFQTAEDLGFDTGWVAQHHARKTGGLPSPLIFLTALAGRTSRLRLATGIIVLPLEQPLRLAEDAAVLDILSDGRLELGFGTGGDAAVFASFGRDVERRQQDYDEAFDSVYTALAGHATPFRDGTAFFPPAASLTDRLWEATFGVDGAIRAARHGSGLLLSRTMPRPAPSAGASASERISLGDLQWPVVDAYLSHWTSTTAAPRLGLSRSLYVAPSRAEALADAEAGMRRQARFLAQRDPSVVNLSVEELLARGDIHLGNPDDVIASLRADRLLAHATDLILQVHPVDPAPERTLRSLTLLAEEVAPALGWRPAAQSETPALATTSRP